MARRHVLPAIGIGFAGELAGQAFRWGVRAYGVQFHLEVSLDMAREWLQVPEYAKSLNDSLGPGSVATLIDQFGKHEERLREQGRRLFERWLNLC